MRLRMTRISASNDGAHTSRIRDIVVLQVYLSIIKFVAICSQIPFSHRRRGL